MLKGISLGNSKSNIGELYSSVLNISISPYVIRIQYIKHECIHIFDLEN